MLRSKRFIKVALVAGAVSASALLYVACGSDGSSPEAAKVATTDTNVPVTASTIDILYAAPLSFSSGIPALGTTAATTLAFSANPADAAKPLFSIKTATDSASGTTAFGSCHFLITAKTAGITSVHVGDTVVVDPCNVVVATNGKSAGTAIQAAATLELGSTTTSQPSTLEIKITDGGKVSVIVGGVEKEVGTVVVVKPSGA